jgi:16S rRNA U516 pseudouridylate synthase RsuA-like enzyme
VRRLKRVAFGPLELGDLPVGQWRELSPAEVARLAAAGTGGPAPPRAP